MALLKYHERSYISKNGSKQCHYNKDTRRRDVYEIVPKDSFVEVKLAIFNEISDNFLVSPDDSDLWNKKVGAEVNTATWIMKNG